MSGPPKTTAYFREQVLRKRPYLKIEWCLDIVANPVDSETQGDGRLRFWVDIAEYGEKALRVVTLEDGETCNNAFPDSGYVRRK